MEEMYEAGMGRTYYWDKHLSMAAALFLLIAGLAVFAFVGWLLIHMWLAWQAVAATWGTVVMIILIASPIVYLVANKVLVPND